MPYLYHRDNLMSGKQEKSVGVRKITYSPYNVYNDGGYRQDLHPSGNMLKNNTKDLCRGTPMRHL
jgi:hypothetical protein